MLAEFKLHYLLSFSGEQNWPLAFENIHGEVFRWYPLDKMSQCPKCVLFVSLQMYSTFSRPNRQKYSVGDVWSSMDSLSKCIDCKLKFNLSLFVFVFCCFLSLRQFVFSLFSVCFLVPVGCIINNHTYSSTMFFKTDSIENDSVGWIRKSLFKKASRELNSSRSAAFRYHTTTPKVDWTIGLELQH